MQHILLIVAAILLGSFFGLIFAWRLMPLVRYLAALAFVLFVVRRSDKISRKMKAAGDLAREEMRALQGERWEIGAMGKPGPNWLAQHEEARRQIERNIREARARNWRPPEEH